MSLCAHIQKSAFGSQTVRSSRISFSKLCLRPSHAQEYMNYIEGSTVVVVQRRNSVVVIVPRKILAVYRTCLGIWDFILQWVLTFEFASAPSLTNPHQKTLNCWVNKSAAPSSSNIVDHTYQKCWWKVWQCLHQTAKFSAVRYSISLQLTFCTWLCSQPSHSTN